MGVAQPVTRGRSAGFENGKKKNPRGKNGDCYGGISFVLLFLERRMCPMVQNPKINKKSTGWPKPRGYAISIVCEVSRNARGNRKTLNEQTSLKTKPEIQAVFILLINQPEL